MTGTPPRLVVRPRTLRWTAWVTATLFLAVLTVAGVLLRIAPTGVYFRVADQVALIVLGARMAAGALLFARPRVRADAEGVEVRNLLGARWVPWSEVRGVSFPDGASWARLDLDHDEYLPMLAIQSSDRQHAVAAMSALRDLHAAHRATAQ
jgi:hypothetical protein